MKSISNHLGEIIVALACVALLISAIALFGAPIGDFFESIIEKETAMGGEMMTGIENIDVSNIGVAGSGGGEGGSGGAGGGGGGSQGVITNYTQEDIDNSDGKLVAIGATDPLYVVAKFNDDYSEVTITKNGASSDGAMSASALANTSSLASVTIKEGVTTIGVAAFEGCTNLTDITMSNSLTIIGDYAFASCTSLTDVTIANGVTTISEGAFAYCESLADITIANSVKTIGAQAFDTCTSLTKITIPNSVTSIGDLAFAYCSSLTDVTIPNSVTNIGARAFCDCTELYDIDFNGTKEEWGDISLGTNWNMGTGGLDIVHCTDGDVSVPLVVFPM